MQLRINTHSRHVSKLAARVSLYRHLGLSAAQERRGEELSEAALDGYSGKRVNARLAWLGS